MYEDFNINVFRHMMSYSLVGRYQCTEGIYFLYLMRGRNFEHREKCIDKEAEKGR